MSSGLVDPNDPLLPEVERRGCCAQGICCDNRVARSPPKSPMLPLRNLGIPRSTLLRAVARFRRTRRASSLLPLKRGTRDGSSLLDPRIERIIEEQIERFWLKKERLSIQRAYGNVCLRTLAVRRRFAAEPTSKNNQTPRRGPNSAGGGPPKQGRGPWRRRLPQAQANLSRTVPTRYGKSTTRSSISSSSTSNIGGQLGGLC